MAIKKNEIKKIPKKKKNQKTADDFIRECNKKLRECNKVLIPLEERLANSPKPSAQLGWG